MNPTAEGLFASPGPQARGMLLLTQAFIMNAQGRRQEAIRLLGELAVDNGDSPQTEHLAKDALANLLGRH